LAPAGSRQTHREAVGTVRASTPTRGQRDHTQSRRACPGSPSPQRVENERQSFVFVGDKELKRLQQAAWKAGWWPEQKKSGILWLAPDGVGQVLLHGSASDHHAYKNARGLFRKAGLAV